jgi:hypothetical protein
VSTPDQKDYYAHRKERPDGTVHYFHASPRRSWVALFEVPEPIETGDACDRAQAQLVELGCEWRVNSAGGTWASSCVYLAGKGYPRVLVAAECVAASTTCAGAKACH